MFYSTFRVIFGLFIFLQCVCLRADPQQVVKKISITKEGNRYQLRLDFSETFVPRIHLLPGGVKLLLSFSCDVAIPPARKMDKGIIRGYVFERFSPSSLMFVCALHENVTFISKRYSKHSIRITFEIHKKRTVVIDPGHGGKDPGASGITGNCEKNITMVTAVELRNALLKSGKYKVVLTRERDMFITNEERINKIKAANADFLISLHTDSNKDTNIRGMTVYTLPKLDVIRNAAGVDNIKDYCKILGQSEKFAKLLVRFFPNTCKMSNQPCRNSEFKVLKADVPAVLIELGCISNKIDNELLHSREFREKTIMAIQYALDSFLGDDKQ